jgi:diaminopimelate epimerase
LNIHFFKYQATGNDFVLIDNLSGKYSFSTDQIKAICDRRFGVGADGLMLIEKHPSAHFNLQYYNSDGSQSLCGNGSRAAVKMAATLGIVNGRARFEAYDGLHEAEIQKDGIVRLRMNDVSGVERMGDDYFINTGSPHFVRFVRDLGNYSVVEHGKEVRYRPDFSPGGTNVNFVELGPANSIFVRTYERGVEDETLSCGTGVTAAALASSFQNYTSPVSAKTRGGDLQVQFKAGHSGTFQDIYLIGPAKLVFEGDLEL